MARCLSLIAETKADGGRFLGIRPYIALTPPDTYDVVNHREFPFPHLCVGSSSYDGTYYVVSKDLEDQLRKNNPFWWRLTRADLLVSSRGSHRYLDQERGLRDSPSPEILLFVSGFEDLTAATVEPRPCPMRGKYGNGWLDRLVDNAGKECEICGARYNSTGLHPDDGFFEDWLSLSDPRASASGIEFVHWALHNGCVNQWLLKLKPGAVLRATYGHEEFFYGHTGRRFSLFENWVTSSAKNKISHEKNLDPVV